jgi:hypothetical protein
MTHAARAFHIEELRGLFPPALVLLSERREPLPTIFGVAFQESRACFGLWQRGRVDVDAEHGATPRIFAHALVHHLLVHTAAARVALTRSDGKVLVLELAPHA